MQFISTDNGLNPLASNEQLQKHNTTNCTALLSLALHETHVDNNTALQTAAAATMT